MLASMLLVAASEHPDQRWSHGSTLWAAASAPAAPLIGYADERGAAVAGGCALRPRLLPVPPEASGGRAPAAGQQASKSGGRAALVTGGTGALGLLLARKLLPLGAAHVVLAGRSARLAAEGPALDPLLRGRRGASGCLTIAACDCTAASDAEGVAVALEAAGACLGGIYHAAGVRRDGLLAGQTLGALRAVLAPKAPAARRLLRAVGGLHPVPHVVLFGSVASLLGSAGQANYAAANAALDGLTEGWHFQGTPVVSVAWGAWGGGGMAAADPAVLTRLRRLGISAMPPATGLAVLEAMLAGTAPARATTAAAQVAWARVLADAPPQARPFYAEVAALAAAPGGSSSSGGGGGGGGALLRAAPAPPQDGGQVRGEPAEPVAGALAGTARGQRPASCRAEPLSPKSKLALVTARVRAAVAAVLEGGGCLTDAASLMAAGLDSLGALDLRKQLSSAFAMDLPPTLIFDYPSIGELAAALVGRVADAALDPSGGAAANDAASIDASSVAAPAADASAADGSGADDDAAAAESAASPAKGRAPTCADSGGSPCCALIPAFRPEEERGSRGQPAAVLAPSAAANVVAALPPLNPRAPTLTRPGYYTVPSMRRLRRMTDAELRAVPRLVVGRQGVGEIAFLYPVDLLGVDLDAAVALERGRFALYPQTHGWVQETRDRTQEAGAAEQRNAARHLALPRGASAPGPPPPRKPPPGCGLNQPAIVTLRRMTMRDSSNRRAVDALRGRLAAAAARMGAVQVHYDAGEGVWMLKLDAF